MEYSFQFPSRASVVYRLVISVSVELLSNQNPKQKRPKRKCRAGHTVELGRMFSNAGGTFFWPTKPAMCKPCVTTWLCTSPCRGLPSYVTAGGCDKPPWTAAYGVRERSLFTGVSVKLISHHRELLSNSEVKNSGRGWDILRVIT